MCGAHATVRGFLGELVSSTSGRLDVVVDMEAGLEHLSRGTGKHLSGFVAVVEPYYRSMETARRIAELAAGLGVEEVVAVTNKIRDETDRDLVNGFCAAHGLQVVADIPYDPALLAAERAGRPPLDFDADSPAVLAIGRLGATLRQRYGE